MNFDGINIPQKLVPKTYLQLGLAAQRLKQRNFKELLEKRKVPENGWRDEDIEEFIHNLGMLDSNNFSQTVGLGEREGRIACNLVARRNYNFGHGIGRSGDLLAAQPKAAGSTLLANLTNALLLDLIQYMGVNSCRGCFLVPMATGMTITLCLLALRKLRPNAVYVLWSRIDQKSCFKAITVTGLQAVIIPGLLLPKEQCLVTDTKKFEEKIQELGLANILCMYTTTSCFAPRNSDNIIEIARLAKCMELPHVVNNAYGLQSRAVCLQLEHAQRVGRIDCFVQSTDKNLLVPVGGAIVATHDAQLLKHLASTYPGRGSISQMLDVLMTLISLGRRGYQSLIEEREINFLYLKERLQKFALEHQEIVPQTESNYISLALSLRTFVSKSTTRNVTELGSMLYTRGVSGVRVVPVGVTKCIDGYELKNFGSHCDQLDAPYLTVAAALGISRPQINKFFEVLDRCWKNLSQSELKMAF